MQDSPPPSSELAQVSHSGFQLLDMPRAISPLTEIPSVSRRASNPDTNPGYLTEADPVSNQKDRALDENILEILDDVPT